METCTSEKSSFTLYLHWFWLVQGLAILQPKHFFDLTFHKTTFQGFCHGFHTPTLQGHPLWYHMWVWCYIHCVGGDSIDAVNHLLRRWWFSHNIKIDSQLFYSPCMSICHCCCCSYTPTLQGHPLQHYKWVWCHCFHCVGGGSIGTVNHVLRGGGGWFTPIAKLISDFLNSRCPSICRCYRCSHIPILQGHLLQYHKWTWYHFHW